jgi:glyoxylate/hydroxypyruvate reductase A
MSAQKPAIALALRFWNPAPWLERFCAACPDREIIDASDPATPLPERHYLGCWKPDPAVFKREPKPLAIFSFGAGVDAVMDARPPAGVPIGRIIDPDLSGRMVEYVVLHALWHFRRMSDLQAAQGRREWLKFVQPAAREATVGLMGVGEMGQASAAGLKAVGFTVIGWGRGPRPGLAFESFHGSDGLDDFLARTDILVSLLPSTQETRGLIDYVMLTKLRRPGPIGGPYFINAGRGDAMVEADVMRALGDGTIRAASLDVFHTEPLPAESPFWSLPNVLVTPHNAADSSPEAIVANVLAEIGRLESGLPLKNAVDLALGY